MALWGGTVVGKFQCGEKCCPILLSTVNEGAQHLLDGRVGSLYLTVGLGMPSAGKGALDVETLTEHTSKFGDKAGVSNRYNGLGKSMISYDPVRKQLDEVRCGQVASGRDEVSHFDERVCR